MKEISTIIIGLLFITFVTKAQPIINLEISPINSTENDTIRLVSNLTSARNFSYRLVDYFVDIENSIINIRLLYRGYFDTIINHSEETHTEGTFPARNHKLKLKYHQGSHYPYIGFIIVIGEKVYQSNFHRPKTEIIFSFQPKGDYFLKLIDGKRTFIDENIIP